MKVLVLHPPMYPVNYDFYNYLGESVDLTIFQFGEYPSDHPSWTANSLKKMRKNFKLQVFGTGSDSLKNQFYSLNINQIRLVKPNIVLSIAFWLPSFYFSLLSRILNFKFLILTNAIDATEQQNTFFRDLYRKTICLNTTCFISASSKTSLYLQSLCIKNQIELSIQTIEVKNWRKNILALDSKQKLRLKLKLPQDKIILLGVGNFIHKKNWISVLHMMKEEENCIFVLIGGGENYADYNSYIVKNELKSKVIMLDRKEGIELKKYFKSSDIFILPSLFEQFGFVVLEALASDLPVLCSNNAGASSLIVDGYNGYVFNPKENANSYLKKIINNLDIFQSNAFKSVENKTLKNRAHEFHTIFKKVL